MTLLDCVAVAVIVGGVVFLRRQIVALGRRASVAARRRPVLWSTPLVLLGLLVAWKGPEWELASRTGSLTAREYLELQNSYRATFVQALGGLFLLLGIYLTWRRVTATEQQVQIAGEGQITERFTRAIEHLGSDKLAVRLGGIYALERIARDSEKDHWPIMEVLTAYVRKNARAPEEEAERKKGVHPEPPAIEIQAILTVLARRTAEWDRGSLDLQGTDLAAADLVGTHLEEANLSQAFLREADLRGADLRKADLSNAILWGAQACPEISRQADSPEFTVRKLNLTGAYLYQADLWGAALPEANLSGAKLLEANLRAADLAEANLTGALLIGANLVGTDLSKVEGLTREQIESAITDETTILPDYLKEGGEEPAKEAAGGEAS